MHQVGLKVRKDGINVEEIALLAETWVSMLDKDATTAIRPSEDPKRKEAVTMAVEDRTGNQTTYTYIFERDGEKIIFKNPKAYPKTIRRKAKEASSLDSNQQMYPGLLGYFWRAYLNLNPQKDAS
jgi:hypothetical protein